MDEWTRVKILYSVITLIINDEQQGARTDCTWGLPGRPETSCFRLPYGTFSLHETQLELNSA